MKEDDMIRAMTIIRVSSEDQLRGYGPDVQWFEDVLPGAERLGLEVHERYKRVIQEPATRWEREKFEAAVREAIAAYDKGEIQALVFPRVDRETRFLFGSFPLLAEVVRAGLKVYFARERLFLDPTDPESIERYLAKATQAQAYVETMRLNTARGRRRRAIQDHKIPNGQARWPFDYNPQTGRATPNPERSAWVRKWVEWLLEEGVPLGTVCGRMQEAGVPAPKGGMVWSRSTVTRILADPELIGEFYAWKGKKWRMDKESGTEGPKPELVYSAPHEAILTREQFAAIQEKLRDNRANAPRNAKLDYPPLRGLLFCRCGRRLGGVPMHGHPFYRCPSCRRPLVHARNLWNSVQGAIREMLLAPERLIPAIRSQLESGTSLQELERERLGKEAEVVRWEQAEDKAVKMHLVLPDYPLEKLRERVAEVRTAKAQAERELAELEARLEAVHQARVDEEGVRRFCEIASRNIDYLVPSQWRVILEKLRVRIKQKEDGGFSIQMAVRPMASEIALQPS